MSACPSVIEDIQTRIVELIDSATLCPQTRRVARVLAAEFAHVKFAEGLEYPPEQVDVEGSARHILKEQVYCLYEGRSSFTPPERMYLKYLADLVAKL